MSLLKEESYKLFIKRFFLVFVVFFLFLDFLFACREVKNASNLSERSLSVYKEYIEEFGGPLTEEKLQKVEKLQNEAAEISEGREKIYNAYKSEKITLVEYEKLSEEYNRKLTRLDGLNAFLRVYNRARTNDIEIVDSTVWSVLLENKSVDLFTLIPVILMVLLLVIIDRESGMDYIKSSTVNGKERLWNIQLLLIVLVPFVTGIFSGALRFLAGENFYGISSYNVGLKSIEGFDVCEKDISVICAYLLSVLLKSFGLSFLSVMTYAVGVMLNSSLYTAFFGFAVTYLPGYVLKGKRILFYLPFPSALLSPNGWFSAFLTDGESMTAALPFGHMAVYSAIIFLLIIILSLVAVRERKRKVIV